MDMSYSDSHASCFNHFLLLLFGQIANETEVHDLKCPIRPNCAAPPDLGLTMIMIIS
jgi:hypothetical protein